MELDIPGQCAKESDAERWLEILVRTKISDSESRNPLQIGNKIIAKSTSYILPSSNCSTGNRLDSEEILVFPTQIGNYYSVTANSGETSLGKIM